MPICPVQRKTSLLHNRYKEQPPFSPSFFAPLALCAKIATRETWVRPAYACKILSGSVKVCWSYSRKADFQQIHITLSYIYRVAQLKWGQLTFLMVTF